MTLTIQSTDIIGTGTAFSLAAAGDSYFILAGVTVASTSGDAIRSDFDNSNITILGTVIANNYGVRINGDDTYLEVGVTGGIFAQDLGILANFSNSNIITNIVNNGYVSAGTGIFMAANGAINNGGTINAYGDSDTVGRGYAISIQPTFTNSLDITNTGTLSGAVGAIGTGSSRTGGISVETVFNTGDIFGTVSLYRGDDIYINRGLSVGDVDMGDDNDLYYGRYGAVEGDIFLGAGNDTASGGAEGERIEDGDGIDRIFVFGGDDNLFGDDGNDVLRGGDGTDGVNGGIGNDDLGGGAGNDTLLGADGNDLLRGDFGADVLNGGDGFDRASYGDSSTGITIDLADTGLSTGFAQGDSYVSIEAYEATAFADVMFGDDVNNLLRGMDGDDQISGRGGNDNLQGFDGDDILSGGTGNDTLNGGDGDDIAAFTGDQADYTFTLLGNGNIRVEDTVGSDGIDVLIAVEFVTFGGGAEIDVTGLI